MRVTMKDIAKAAGVSVTTVSKVLNNDDKNIGKETIEKVKNIIKASGYIPNSAAQSLKTKSTKTIGFILPDMSNPFYPEIARGIYDEAKRRGFATIMCNTDNDANEESKAFEFLTSKMVDGIIYVHNLTGITCDWIKTCKTPMVVVDRRIKNSNKSIGKIYVNTELAMKDSVKYLIDKGCKNIALVTAPSNGFDLRVESYQKTLKDNKITFSDDLVYIGQYDAKTGQEAVNHFISNSIQFDGIACGNDLIALGVLNALQSNGIKVPEQVKVIGYDDIMFSALANPPLTTIHQPAYEMGCRSAEMIISHIIDNKPMKEEELQYSLIVRESA